MGAFRSSSPARLDIADFSQTHVIIFYLLTEFITNLSQND